MYLKDPQTNEFGQSERPSVVTWPTMALYPLGKIVGWLCGLRIGVSWLTVGNFFALITIPVTLCLYCWKMMPFIMRRYMLTDVRVVLQKGWSAVIEASIRYDQFDRIVSVVYPGQKFYRSADLFFYQGERIVFVLESVRFPDVFIDQTMRARKCYLAFQTIQTTQRKAA